MKFYNNFNSMFNAQSCVKKDTSVFNKVVLLDHKPADEHTAQWLDYEPYETYKYTVLQDIDDSWYDDVNVESCRWVSGAYPSRITVSLLMQPMRENATSELVGSVVDDFVSKYGGLVEKVEKRRPGKDGDFTITFREDYEEVSELARELAENIDATLYSSEATTPKHWISPL